MQQQPSYAGSRHSFIASVSVSCSSTATEGQIMTTTLSERPQLGWHWQCDRELHGLGLNLSCDISIAQALWLWWDESKDHSIRESLCDGLASWEHHGNSARKAYHGQFFVDVLPPFWPWCSGNHNSILRPVCRSCFCQPLWKTWNLKR